MFESIDGSKARDELKSLQNEYANLARAAGDAGRIAARAHDDAAAAIRRVTEVNSKYGESASQTARALGIQHDMQARAAQAALDAAAATDAASAAHDRLGEATGRAGSAAEGMNSSMLLAAGGVAALGVAAVEGTRRLFEMGEQWADLSDKITFTTGKVGADVTAMTDSIANIADRTAAPVDSIAQVYSQLTRLKELQGSTLDEMTKQIADYDQMAEKAGGEPLNIGAFTRTLQEFHVPAAQAGTDLDTIVSAAQDGQVPLNELVQTMQTFGPTADLMGLSFAQTSNLLAVLDESGVDVDKTLQSFRVGLTALAKDAPALQKQIKFGPDENDLQRMKDVVEKMQELYQENTAAASDAADKLGATVFGKQWEAIADDIKNGKLNLDDLNTSASATPGKIEQMRTATQRFGDDWQIVKNQIQDALKPLSEDVFKHADDQLMTFSENLRKLMSDTGSVSNWMHFLFDGSVEHPEIKERDNAVPHASNDPDAFKDLGGGGKPTPQDPTGAGAPTSPDIPTSAPYHPLDLNPADKPAGAETYDEWINSQKAVQSAQNRQSDTANQLAAAQKRQADLLASGKATQEQLNSVAEEISKAQRDNLEATQELTVAQQKYTEDANKTVKERQSRSGRGGSSDNYDPFTEATKNSQGLIPELASLAAAFVTNEALGNPYGKLQAEKRGLDPSTPLYVSDVSSTDGSGAGSGLSGVISRFFRQGATGQAPQSGSHLADWDKVAGAESSGNWADNTGNGFYGGLQFSQSSWDAAKPAGAPDRADQATPEQQKQAADKLMSMQGSGAWPATSAAHPDWFKPTGDQTAMPTTPPGGAGGLNLTTIPVAAQKYANDCIDASARIILSHAGVNMSEDQLEGVIAPGGSIDSQAAGLNKLDPQGKFTALQGSGGSQQAMFRAIQASIINGTGSILNVAPGSSLAGHTFAPGHFIAVTGVNPDGSINVSDTAGGKTYSVSQADAFQATQGRGIVAGTGSGPVPDPGNGGSPALTIPGSGGVSYYGKDGTPYGPNGLPMTTPNGAAASKPGALPGILGQLFNPGPQGPQTFASGGSPHPMPGIPSSDTVPTMLTPGEFVVKKDVAQKNMAQLQAMNSGHDPAKPTPGMSNRAAPEAPTPGSRKGADSSSVTPPPPGPRVGQGTGSGFGIGGGLIGMAETAAIMAAEAAAAAGAGMALGGVVPDTPGPGVGAAAGAPLSAGASASSAAAAGAPGGGGATGGGGGSPSGGGGDPLTAVANRTVGYVGQLVGIGVQGAMSSLIPGASQKGGIMDGGILAKLAGGIAGAHPSAPNTAGNTAKPLDTGPNSGVAQGGGDVHNHIGTQAGVSIGTLINQNGQSGDQLAQDLAFRSYAGYNGR